MDIDWEEGRCSGEGVLPVKASSGRTSISMSFGGSACRRALARATFSGSLPSSGLNCRHAMRMLHRKLDEREVVRMKLWGCICSPINVLSHPIYKYRLYGRWRIHWMLCLNHSQESPLSKISDSVCCIIEWGRGSSVSSLLLVFHAFCLLNTLDATNKRCFELCLQADNSML